MSKRRKVWWIVGGFVVLYSATALYVSWNSPYAKLEQALQEIIEENGFEHKANEPEKKTGVAYEGKLISQDGEKRILAKFNKAFPSCSSNVYTFGTDYSVITGSTSEPTFDMHYWVLDDGSSFRTIEIVFDDKALVGTSGLRLSRLEITRYDEGGWSFLKYLWPW